MSPDSDSNKTVQASSSEEAPVPVAPHIPSEHLSTDDQQILSFVDASPNMVVAFDALSDPTYTADATPNDDLATFLSRPVKIHEVDWIQGAPYAGATVRPWHLFFNTAAIKKKIDNYAFLSCNLHLKIVVNASPFYYGAMLANYNPMPDITEFPTNSPSAASALVYKSQRPHVWVYPQNNQGGELVLPFFFPKNWMDITTPDDLLSIGSLTVSEVIPLLHANGLAGGTISVQIYAWAENVRLTGPTFSLAIQTGEMKKIRTSGKKSDKDEYTQGPISRVASTVSNMASLLTSVPVFAPFAKATQIGADAVHGIASLFGFSKVPVISDTMPMRNIPFGSFANTEIGTPIQKLSLDPKNELSLDPRTVGLSGGDEMSICYIACRESYVKYSTWAVSDPVNTILMQVGINPTITANPVVGVNQTSYNVVPMGLLAQNFRLWRGNIIVRLKAICTQYHKGRVRISWDPLYTPGFGDDNTTTSFSKIVDLTPDLDIEFEIDYLQSRHWLKTLALTNGSIPRVNGDILYPPGKTLDPNFYNGTFTVQVLNDLSGPTASSVSLMLFVKGSPSLEFCDPYMHATPEWSYFEVQSGDMVSCDSSMSRAPPSGSETDSYTVFAGEVVRSMRVLLHRTNTTSPITYAPFTGSAFSLYAWAAFNQSAYPDPVGFNPDGDYRAIGITSGLPEKYDYGMNTPFHLLVPCYAGMRGSMHWHFNPYTRNGITPANIEVCRDTRYGFFGPAGKVSTGFTNISPDPGYIAHFRSQLGQVHGESSVGLEIMNPRTTGAVSISIPFYANTRFYGTRVRNWNHGVAADDSAQKRIIVSAVTTGVSTGTDTSLKNFVVDRYFETGPDFNLFFFVGVPPIYVYGAIPAFSPTV